MWPRTLGLTLALLVGQASGVAHTALPDSTLWVQARQTGDVPAERLAGLRASLKSTDDANAALAAATLWSTGRVAPPEDGLVRDALLRGLGVRDHTVRVATFLALAERAAWADDAEAALELASVARGRLNTPEAEALAQGATWVAAAPSSAAAETLPELVRELLRALPRLDPAPTVAITRALVSLPKEARDALLPTAEATEGVSAALLDVVAEADLAALELSPSLVGVLGRELDRRGAPHVLRLLAVRDIRALRPRLVALLSDAALPHRVAAARIAARLGLEDTTHTLRELFGALTNDADRLVVAAALLRLGSGHPVPWLTEHMADPAAPRVEAEVVTRAVDTGSLDPQLLEAEAAERYLLERTAAALTRTATGTTLVAFLDALEAAPETHRSWILRWMWSRQRGALISALGEEAAATIDGGASMVPSVVARADRLVDLLGALLHADHIDRFDRSPFGLLHAIAADTDAPRRIRDRALLAMLRGGKANERFAVAQDFVAALAPPTLDPGLRDADALDLLAAAKLCGQARALAGRWAAELDLDPGRMAAVASARLACSPRAPETLVAARRAVAARGSDADHALLGRVAAAVDDHAAASRATYLSRRAAAGGVSLPGGAP